MTPYNIRSGWWVLTEERFVTRHNTKEEAIDHVKYQKSIGSKAKWYIQHIKIKFEESINYEEL